MTAGDIKLTIPEAWTQKETTSRFRLAQFSIPKTGDDKEDAEFIVFYFARGEGETSTRTSTAGSASFTRKDAR